MGDFGKVVFYYDYERDEKIAGDFYPLHVNGVVAKRYRGCGEDGMILHAFNGVRFFLTHFNSKWYTFNIKETGHISNVTTEEWMRLNTAFDVFFEHYDIDLGDDLVTYAIEDLENGDKETKKLLEEAPLFADTSSFGDIKIIFTGNPRDGYSLKYAYDYQDKLGDMKSVFGENYDSVNEPTKDAVKFFEENATLITDESEFYDIESKGSDIVKELFASKKELKEKRNPEYVDIEWSEIKDEDGIELLGFSVRTYNCLRRGGISTVGELKKKTPEEIAAFRNMTPKSVDEIMKRLDEVEKAKNEMK